MTSPRLNPGVYDALCDLAIARLRALALSDEWFEDAAKRVTVHLRSIAEEPDQFKATVRLDGQAILELSADDVVRQMSEDIFQRLGDSDVE